MTKTDDALDIIYSRFYKDHLERLAKLQEESINDSIALGVHLFRQKLDSSIKEFSILTGVDTQTLQRIEGRAYNGDPISVFKQIANKLGYLVKIELMPLSSLDE